MHILTQFFLKGEKKSEEERYNYIQENKNKKNSWPLIKNNESQEDHRMASFRMLK